MYHWFVRPKWITKKYIHDQIQSRFPIGDQFVLDFGAGTGANCPMFAPSRYVGVDPDADRIRYARALYPGYTFHVLENGRLPVEDESVDRILIVAVLHHISSGDIEAYMPEFRRIMKPSGTIIVMEPCLCKEKPVSNRFMKWYDSGQYIRYENEYLQFFRNHGYECEVHKRFRKCFLYHELFFSAVPKESRTAQAVFMPDPIVAASEVPQELILEEGIPQEAIPEI
jgi:ubiquinone/menaquinone biosynthesis C-methylase UbiE